MFLTEYGKSVAFFTQKLLINLYLFWQRKLYGKDFKYVENTDDEIALQAQYICEKYMEQKFSNTSEEEVFKTRYDKNICSTEVIKTMTRYGRILEKSYPALYNDVVHQMNFRINYEIVICGLFTCVCDNILSEGITWAKIVSMYAFAAALAKDCCQANDFKTAKNLPKWMGQYTRKRLVDWIRRHGGWVSSTHFGIILACSFIELFINSN